MIKENTGKNNCDNFKVETRKIWEETNHKYIPILIKKKARSKLESLKKTK